MFYLSETPSPPVTPYSPLPYITTVYVYAYSLREWGGGGGEQNKEKVIGAIFKKANRK